VRDEKQFLRRYLLLRQLSGAGCAKRGVGQLQRHLAQCGVATTTRTIQRDLLWLSRYFPLCSDDARPRGWYWSPESEDVRIPRMDSLTALTLLLSYESLRPILPPALLENWDGYRREAQRLLAQSSLGDWQRHALVLPSGLQAPPALPAWTLTQVLEALENRRRLRFVYRAQGRTSGKPHRVSPWGVVLQDGTLYLVACNHRREQPLLFACQRMQAVRMESEEALAMPADFSLREFAETNLRFTNSGEPIRLRFRVHREIAYLFRERPLGRNPRVEAEGRLWVTLSTDIADSWALHWWILSYGEQIQVLGPASVVRRLRETTAAMARLYAPKARNGRSTASVSQGA